MVNSQLVQYIVDNVKKGYNYQQLRAYLIQSRYPVVEVDEAINFAYHQTVQVQAVPQKHGSHAAFAVVFSLVILVITLALFMMLKGDEAPVTTHISIPDYSLNILSQKIKAGDILSFENKFESSTDILGYTIYPSYKIYKKDNNLPVLRWSVDSGIEIGGNTKVDKSISLEPGSYYIEGNALYKGNSISATGSFVVYQDSSSPSCTNGIKNQGETDVDCGGSCQKCVSCSDGIKNQGETDVDCGGPCDECATCDLDCNDENICTKDSCENDKCVNEIILPCCGNFICELGEDQNACKVDCEKTPDKPVELLSKSEIIEKGKSLVLEHQKEASDFCYSVVDAKNRDECFYAIAYEGTNSNFCAVIVTTSKKDACYMEFAMQYDYSVCPKISDVYLQKTFKLLKKRPQPNGE